MKSLRAAAIILSLTAFIVLIGAAIEGLMYGGSPAAAWGLFVSAVMLTVVALIVNGVASIGAAVIESLEAQRRALGVIVGRRGDGKR